MVGEFPEGLRGLDLLRQESRYDLEVSDRILPASGRNCALAVLLKILRQVIEKPSSYPIPGAYWLATWIGSVASRVARSGQI